RAQAAGITRDLEVINRFVQGEARTAMHVLQGETQRAGAPSISGTAQVGTETIPNLVFGGVSQANNSAVADKVAELTGGTIALFVKRLNDVGEAEFIQVSSSSAQGADDSRAVGTKLERINKGFERLRAGESFYGMTNISGLPHIAAYEPIRDNSNNVIGALHVGYPMRSLSEIGAAIEETKLLEQGFVALIDSNGKPVFKSRSADAEFVRKLEEAKSGIGINGSLMDNMGKASFATEAANWNYLTSQFEPWNYKVVAAYSNSDPALSGLVGRSIKNSMLQVLVFALLISALCYLLVRQMTKPLATAVEAADALAGGNVSVDLTAPRHNDEVGQLLSAMEHMTRYFKEMADVSDRIADGDLSVEVTPRSPDDRFGQSFQRMTNYLRGMANVSDEIAAGNLQVNVEPRSERDRFGIAFKNMLDNTLSLVQSREQRDAIQESIMKLLQEVSEVASGDLRAEAEVTANETGAIADAFNFMIAELRQVITQVKQATLQVSSSAGEIQTTTEQLAEGSEAQSLQIAETSRNVEEMATSIQQVSEAATLSANVADEARSSAQQGSTAVQNNITAMGKIRDQVQETAKRIKRLGERSQEIGEITTVIDDIAVRTSLLALNASIQASMAGEAGRGFAVVAEEVERLADRSANATKQIATLIKTIQSETNEAVAAMEDTTHEVVEGSGLANEAGGALAEIETVSNRLANLIGSISEASRQQARGSEEIARAMVGISDVTRQVATGTRQATVSVRGLVSLAETLRGSVVAFKLPESNVEETNQPAGAEEPLDLMPEFETTAPFGVEAFDVLQPDVEFAQDVDDPNDHDSSAYDGDGRNGRHDDDSGVRITKPDVVFSHN
ncbi:MAG: methyl-accepting chemotaxis protein, partial [Acidobacteriota bacterium]|nr:methyl-accepting chemotaxis protein [Acidobacteriota bacterium]